MSRARVLASLAVHLRQLRRCLDYGGDGLIDTHPVIVSTNFRNPREKERGTGPERPWCSTRSSAPGPRLRLEDEGPTPPVPLLPLLSLRQSLEERLAQADLRDLQKLAILLDLPVPPPDEE